MANSISTARRGAVNGGDKQLIQEASARNQACQSQRTNEEVLRPANWVYKFRLMTFLQALADDDQIDTRGDVDTETIVSEETSYRHKGLSEWAKLSITFKVISLAIM